MPPLPDFQTNPFYILNAIPADSSTTLSLRAAKPANNYTMEEANEALKRLLAPHGRLKAEIAWLPGVSREQTRILLQIASLSAGQIVSGADADLYGEIPLSPLAKCNIMAWKLELLSNHAETGKTVRGPESIQAWDKYKDYTAALLEAFIEECDFFAEFQQKNILESINTDRRQAYFPQLSSTDLLEKPLAERVKYYVQVLVRFFGQFYPQDIVEILSRVVVRVTRNGRRKPPLLLQLLTNCYERYLQAFLLTENANINRILSRMQIEKSDKSIQAQLAMLMQVLENWLHVTEPVYLCAKAGGKTYYPLLMQHNRLRNAAWSLEEEKNPVRDGILKFLDSHPQFTQGS